MPSFEADPYLKALETRVIETGVEEERPYAVLADTILYPEGGGQPADHGTIDDLVVLDVQRHEGLIRHYLERPAAEGPATVRLDWRRRFDHMQQHTAQHLLTAVADDRFGWPTTAFHLGEETCDVELDVARLAPVEIEMLEEAAVGEIRAARAVSIRQVSPEVFTGLEVRTRGLPAGFAGDIRLVEIAGLDLNTCGGTHVASTAEIEAVKLLGSEPMRGGTRLFFIAGGRLRRRLAVAQTRNAALRILLGAADAELASVVEVKLGQLQATEKRLRRLEEELAEALCEALAGRPERVVEAHFDDKDAVFIQRLARQFATAAPDKMAFFTGTAAEASLFVLVAGEHLAVDAQAVGRELAALLGGRGGGSGRLFQGKAASFAARPQALAHLSTVIEKL